MPKELSKSNIEQACEYALYVKWEADRNYGSIKGTLQIFARFFASRGVYTLDSISKADLVAFVKDQQAHGLRPTTVRWRLAMLRAVVGEALSAEPPLATKELPRCPVASKVSPKWWLTPEARVKLTAHLRKLARTVPMAGTMADYVDFVCLTGLRVEEVLRLDRECFRGLDGSRPTLWVPGTKTAASATSLPLSQEAAALVSARFEETGSRVLFDVPYRDLKAYWARVCKPIVDPDGLHKTATLRSLRRTFGAYATQRGVPTAALQKLYRHSDIKTTVGYLNLIGSSDAEALRRWL